MRSSRVVSSVAGALLFAGLPLLGGCSSDHDRSRSSRDYDSDYRLSRDYDAREAGYSHGPWRDSAGNLHHDRDWKDASDRGRLSNDRDDRFERY